MRHLPISTAFLAATLLLIPACGPADGGSAPHEVTIYDQTDEQRYAVVNRELETLDSLSSITGDVARFRGGGNIQINAANPDTPEGYRNALSIEGHNRVRPDYAIRDGRVIPMDFHSTVMFSMYHHLERANDFFTSIGLAEDRIGQRPVHYDVEFNLLGFINLLTDNAAYAPTIDAFLVPPRFLTRGVPLAANRGIVVHEYAHAVFNRVVQKERRVPLWVSNNWSDAARNRLTAINEGLADIYAGLQTDNPTFIGSSISEERFDIDRDLSKDREYTSGLQSEVSSADPANFNPYKLGSVIASTLWSIREGNAAGIDGVTTDLLGTAILEASRRMGDQLDEDVSTDDLFNLIADELPASARGSACDTFRDRLTAIREDLTCDST